MLVCQSCRHLNDSSAQRCAGCGLALQVPDGGLTPIVMPPPAAHPPPNHDDPMIGQVLGNFRIDEKLARGGFGAVYRGTHMILGQPCAIKVLHFHQKDFETEARFKREAVSLAQLHHPNIVRMNDFGMLPSGGFYLVMELLEGATLFSMFKNGVLFSLSRINRFAAQMCEVLGYISSKGMVHRDLKPGNIFIVPDEREGEMVKLIDFGIVSLLFSPDELTQTGAYLGTAKYGSPEQIRGVRELDVRSDLYALGVVLYRMLVGRVPFVGRGGSVMTIIQQQVYEPPPTLASINSTVAWAHELEAFFQKALAKPAEERYASAEAFQEAFAMAMAAQESMMLDGVGDMTMLDASGGKAFDPAQTVPAAGLPPALMDALKEASSPDEKRELLRKMYDEQFPSQSTRTLQPPSSPEEVLLNVASSPSLVGMPAPTLPPPPPVTTTPPSDATQPNSSLMLDHNGAFKDIAEVAKNESMTGEDLQTFPTPLASFGPPKGKGPLPIVGDVNHDGTVPAAINPLLASQSADDELFPVEPTALQRPMMPHEFAASMGQPVDPFGAAPPEDPLDALLSQGDARIAPVEPNAPPWGWICLGAGILLILLWAIF